MYVKLTDKCNMRCAHCGMSATNRGKDMDKKTFIAACKLSQDRGSGIFLGGGEPTIHPEFWELLGLALKYHSDLAEDFRVGVVTNGKKAEDAIALARLAKTGIIMACLSQDQWHDPIDVRVVKAFTRAVPVDYTRTNDNDFREIRTVRPKNVIAVGRGRNIPYAREGCVCPELIVNPYGEIRHCACTGAPHYGTVFGPCIPAEYGDCGSECHKDKPACDATAPLGGEVELVGDLAEIEA